MTERRVDPETGWGFYTIHNWETFGYLIDQTTPKNTTNIGALFRGQADSDWKLEPSLCRIARAQKLTKQHTIELEKKALMEFQQHAYNLVSPNLVSEDIVSWWGLMQHYGAPTRLLDWTGTPYVALYFAVVDRWDCDGAVWMFEAEALNRGIRQKYGSPIPDAEDCAEMLLPNDSDAIYSFRRKKLTDRMIAQQGGFTVCKDVLGNHPQLIKSSSIKNIQIKFIIPRELKPKFLDRLRRMNVTANALFPGVDGLGKSLAELALIEAYYRSSANQI